MKFLFKIFFIVLFIPSVAGAVVQVQNVYTDDGGLLEDGEAITITGVDFGSGPHVTLFEDFETTGDGGATPPSGTTPGSVINTTANIGSWTSTDGGWNGATGVKYDSNHISGSYGGRMYDPGVGHNQATKSFIGTQEFYVSYWFLWPWGTREHMATEPDAFPYSTTSATPSTEHCTNINYTTTVGDKISIWKYVWLFDATHGSPVGTDDDFILISKGTANYLFFDGNDTNLASGGILDYIYETNGAGKSSNPASCWFRHGTWVRVSFWIASKDSDFTGDVDYHFQAIPNGGLMYNRGPKVISMTSVHNDLDISDPPQEVNRLTTLGWMRTTATPNCRLVFDNFYMATGANANARVEVCDSATYTSSTACFIAPSKSWNSSSIKVNVDQGDFTASTKYLFVTNASNSRNTVGYPITFDTDYDPPPPLNDPVVSIVTTDSSLTESDGSTAAFQVSCQEFNSGDCTSLSVDYTASGTATEGTDYAALSGSVTVTDKDTPASISIDPTADSLTEGSETITITLDDGVSYDLDPINYTAITYLYDVELPVVTVTAVDSTASEEE